MSTVRLKHISVARFSSKVGSKQVISSNHICESLPYRPKTNALTVVKNQKP